MKYIFTSLILTLTLSALEIGKIPPHIIIDKDNGEAVAGGAFDSSIIKDKVYVLFYVDPDEKDTNNHVSEAIASEEFNRTKFSSIAIINLDATWLPNFAIASSLKSKQEKYPHTIYVKDKTKYLVDKWNLKDDSNNIYLFNKKGELIYANEGKYTQKQTKELVDLIKENI